MLRVSPEARMRQEAAEAARLFAGRWSACACETKLSEAPASARLGSSATRPSRVAQTMPFPVIATPRSNGTEPGRVDINCGISPALTRC